MRYRRALFLVDLQEAAAPALAVLRRVAPVLTYLKVMAGLPVPSFAWLSGKRLTEPDATTIAALAALHDATTGIAPSIDVQLAPPLGGDALAALCAAEEIDLLVFGARSLKSATIVATQRKRTGIAALWCGGEPASRPIREIGCIGLAPSSRTAIGAFLRDHVDPSMQVAFLTPTAPAPDVLTILLQVYGVGASVEVSSLRTAPSMSQWLEDWTRDRPIDLLVFAELPTALLLAGRWTVPVLLVPPLLATRPFAQRAIDVPDVVDDGGPIRVRLDHVATLGNLASVPDEAFAFVSGGHVVATVPTSAGEGELPAGLGAGSLGVYRVGRDAPAEPLAAIEEWIAVVRPGECAIVLFDSELPDDKLRALTEMSGPSLPQFLAVRLRPTNSCRSIRERLRAVGLLPRVLDARSVLDEGEALDVSDTLDPVRLARVASKLQKKGFPVTAIVHRGPVQPSAQGFVALSGTDLESAMLPTLLEAQPAAANALPWLGGNRIEFEMDNSIARHWLLETIERSTSTLHFQVYMGSDDDVGRPVEAALAAAGARGVKVRVVVDSLHALYGSFGERNPLFERLSSRPGVELRTLRPINELPSLTELKQRDHRKLVVADGQVALISGRNLSHEYYTAFDEVRLTHDSKWREVPWLDAGARVEGPAVAALESSFLETWTEAGGSAFEIVTPPPVGTSSARVVLHRGLRDASTLETYLELIETARSHIYAVNGFPLALELQHALVHALRRGVRVRAARRAPHAHARRPALRWALGDGAERRRRSWSIHA